MLRCRPVLVTFRHFRDREDLLKASKFLKISDSSIYITEAKLDIVELKSQIIKQNGS